MNTSVISLPFLLLFAGCATPKSDIVISRVVQALEQQEKEALVRGRYTEFPYGFCVGIILPSNAPPEQVAAEAMKQAGWAAHDVAVVATRKVRIRPPQGLESLIDPTDLPTVVARRACTAVTAVLVRTPAGERVVLLEFNPPLGGTKELLNVGFWTHRTYDPERVQQDH